MSHTRLLGRLVESFLLLIVFSTAATMATLACSVTDQAILSSSSSDCETITVFGQSIPNVIYKTEMHAVWFSDNSHAEEILTAGLGGCGTLFGRYKVLS
jgi:hypothetical protein